MTQRNKTEIIKLVCDVFQNNHELIAAKTYNL